jgi:O-antigen/teichoic acid export membrane protein
MISKLLSYLDASGRELARDAATAFALRVLGMALAIGFSMAVARLVGVEGAGLYFSAIAVVMMSSSVARMGLDNAMLRLTAVGISRGEWGRVNRIVRSGLGASGLLCLALCAAIFAFAGPVARVVFSEPDLVTPLRIASLGIVTFSLMTLVSQILKGAKRIRDAVLVASVLWPLFGLVLIWPLGSQYGAVGVCVTYVLATAASGLVGWLMWRGVREATSPTPERPGDLWDAARPLWAMSVISMGVLPWVPILLLGVWGETRETGILGIVGRLATLVSFSLMAINNMLGPKFAVLYADGKMGSLQRIARRFALVNVLIAIPAVAVLVFFGDHVLALYGEDFKEGRLALAILTTGQAVNCITGSVGIMLMMSGNERAVRNSALCAAVVVLSMSMLLIPSYGLTGAAIASASALVTMNLFSMTVVYRRLGFVIYPWIR